MGDPYTDANRALWNEWTGVHERSAFYDLEGFRRGGVRLRDYEVSEVGDVEGKDLLHLQCHFGIDTLSWARLGARVTGVDFSDRAVSLARSLAEDLDLPATFLQADVLDLPHDLDGRFDVVYTSRGVIGWLRDLRAWAAGIARALRPGGVFYITEINPVIWVFDDDDDATMVRMRYPYFERDEPLGFDVQGSYADRTAEVQAEREYAWLHGIGDVVSSIAGAGLRVEFLHEWPFLDWEMPFLERRGDVWAYPGPGELPLMFSLRAVKG